MKKAKKILDFFLPLMIYVLVLMMFIFDLITAFEFTIITIALWSYMVLVDIRVSLNKIKISAMYLAVSKKKEDE